MLAKMLHLAISAHQDQFDKGGKPYFLHLLRVMHNLNTDDEELQCMAIGHDLIEDHEGETVYLEGHPITISYATLAMLGFTERIVDGIRALSKVEGQSPEEYLISILLNIDAVRVKKADIEDNSDIKRLKGITEKDFARMQKYHKMYLILKAHLDQYGK